MGPTRLIKPTAEIFKAALKIEMKQLNKYHSKSD